MHSGNDPNSDTRAHTHTHTHVFRATWRRDTLLVPSGQGGEQAEQQRLVTSVLVKTLTHLLWTRLQFVCGSQRFF